MKMPELKKVLRLEKLGEWSVEGGKNLRGWGEVTKDNISKDKTDIGSSSDAAMNNLLQCFNNLLKKTSWKAGRI